MTAKPAFTALFVRIEMNCPQPASNTDLASLVKRESFYI